MLGIIFVHSKCPPFPLNSVNYQTFFQECQPFCGNVMCQSISEKLIVCNFLAFSICHLYSLPNHEKRNDKTLSHSRTNAPLKDIDVR